MKSDRHHRQNSLPFWIRTVVILCVIIGIFFRFYHLDRKVYWIDEVNTSLRSLGYTRTELMQSVFTGEVISVADLQRFQKSSPTKTWTDTFNALSSTAEHTPLYFLLTRAWIDHFGASIHTIRLFPALLSLLLFPALFLFCRQLFILPLPTPHSPLPTPLPWLSIALLAVSPVQVLYAQEARPYTMLMLMTLLSSAVLLKAIRTKTIAGWILYSVTLAIGWYTQLLFGLVAIAHALYVLVLPQLKPVKLAYGLAAIAGSLTVIPWLGLLIKNWDRVQETTASLAEATSFSALLNQWLLNMSRVLVDRELGAANLLLAALALYALYFLCRHTPKQIWLMILAIVGVNFLALAVPDLILGGERSTRLRYLLPAYLGITVAIAHLLTIKAFHRHHWQQRLWRSLLLIILIGGIVGCAINSQAFVWWNKSVPRSAYYLPVSQIINQTVQPLVLSDGRASDLLAFSYWLDADVKLQLVTDPNTLKVAPGFDRIFLLNPSRRMRNILQRRGYQSQLIYRDEKAKGNLRDRLWQLTRNK